MLDVTNRAGFLLDTSSSTGSMMDISSSLTGSMLDIPSSTDFNSSTGTLISNLIESVIPQDDRWWKDPEFDPVPDWAIGFLIVWGITCIIVIMSIFCLWIRFEVYRCKLRDDANAHGNVILDRIQRKEFADNNTHKATVVPNAYSNYFPPKLVIETPKAAILSSKSASESSSSSGQISL